MRTAVRHNTPERCHVDEAAALPSPGAAIARPPRWVQACLVAGLAGTLAYALSDPLGLGGHQPLARDVLVGGIFLLASALCFARAALHRSERTAWTLIGTSVALAAIGGIYYHAVTRNGAAPPAPSPADLLWWASYLVGYLGLYLLVSPRLRSFAREIWLDGLVGGFTLAAYTAVFLAGPLETLTGGSAAEVASNIASPLADLVMLGLIVALMGAIGWHGGARWVLLAVGFAAAAAADTYFAYQTLQGTYTPGGLTELGWLVLAMAIALAAWQPPVFVRPVNFHTSSVLAVPAGFTLLAVALAVYGSFASVHAAAAALVGAAVVAALARTIGAYREVRRLERMAHTDRLTGLLCPEEFYRALEQQTNAASREGAPFGLALLRIDGLRSLNELRGHAGGDQALSAVGTSLKNSTRPGDTLGRIAGTEFAVLLPGADAGEATAAARRMAAAVEQLDDDIRPSCGTATWPIDGPTREMLLLRADVALHEQQVARTEPEQAAGLSEAPPRVRRFDVSASVARRRRQSPLGAPELDQLQAYARDVHRSYALGLKRTRELQESYLGTVTRLAEAVEARNGCADGHVQRVRALGLLLARELNVEEADEPEMSIGFLLHDIGMLAIPGSGVMSAGRPDEQQWDLLRRHPTEGARLLGDLPSLNRALEVVRHHHERWDGGGYPAKLAGEQIPLWARIFSVVDAVDAITSPRPDRDRRPLAHALDELRRGSGSQFDPACIEAFLRIPTAQIDAVIQWDPTWEPRGQEAVVKRDALRPTENA